MKDSNEIEMEGKCSSNDKRKRQGKLIRGEAANNEKADSQGTPEEAYGHFWKFPETGWPG